VIADVAQRWRERRASYRPAGEPIDTRRYEIAPIADDVTAKAFVVEHHYSGTYPAARRRYGLYRAAHLVGVCVFSVPVNGLSLSCLPGSVEEGVELGRLVLKDDVPANGESWFVARAFEDLRREGFSGVISFSDPFPRDTVAGDVVFAGHVGTVYQASNAAYLGRSKREAVRLLPDGSVLTRRAVSKLLHGERGRAYVERFIAARAGARLDGESDRTWIDRVTRTRMHPGNLKYAWTLHRRDRRYLPASLPYVKLRDVARAA
jgi:hypothetical protein